MENSTDGHCELYTTPQLTVQQQAMNTVQHTYTSSCCMHLHIFLLCLHTHLCGAHYTYSCYRYLHIFLSHTYTSSCCMYLHNFLLHTYASFCFTHICTSHLPVTHTCASSCYMHIFLLHMFEHLLTTDIYLPVTSTPQSSVTVQKGHGYSTICNGEQYRRSLRTLHNTTANSTATGHEYSTTGHGQEYRKAMTSSASMANNIPVAEAVADSTALGLGYRCNRPGYSLRGSAHAATF